MVKKHLFAPCEAKETLSHGYTSCGGKSPTKKGGGGGKIQVSEESLILSSNAIYRLRAGVSTQVELQKICGTQFSNMVLS